MLPQLTAGSQLLESTFLICFIHPSIHPSLRSDPPLFPLLRLLKRSSKKYLRPGFYLFDIRRGRSYAKVVKEEERKENTRVLHLLDRGKRKVCVCVCVCECVGGKVESLEVRREEGGDERGTGNHRYVEGGGWVA